MHHKRKTVLVKTKPFRSVAVIFERVAHPLRSKGWGRDDRYASASPWTITTHSLFALITALVTLIPNAHAQDDQRKKTGIREFQPGVSIDWENLAVEVDARVVLREGQLELLACSPQTKEHESILVVNARPLHIFQAMGLVGLESGSPPTYHEKRDQWQQARGEPLDLRVKWHDGEKVQTANPAEWTIEKKSGRPPEKLDWVFSGSIYRQPAQSELSQQLGKDDAHFAADSDGTLVCLVDFDSALISVSIKHTADDAQLWLSANTDAIPPMGTRCTLVLRSAYHPKLEIELTKEGKIKLDGEEVTIERVGAMLTKDRDDRSPRLRVTYDWETETKEIRRVLNDLKREVNERELDPEKHMCVNKKGSPPRHWRTLAPPP